jgi:hypothetical protein
MTDTLDARHVVVVGPMAVGKTTWRDRPRRRMVRAAVADSDADLRAAGASTGRQLAAAEGVAALHRWEADHLRLSLADSTAAVVGRGGQRRWRRGPPGPACAGRARSCSRLIRTGPRCGRPGPSTRTTTTGS